jgi:hypothetical protein
MDLSKNMVLVVVDPLRRFTVKGAPFEVDGAESIVNGIYFEKIIPESWNKSSCAEGKLAVCAKTCGTKYDAFTNQFT